MHLTLPRGAGYETCGTNSDAEKIFVVTVDECLSKKFRGESDGAAHFENSYTFEPDRRIKFQSRDYVLNIRWNEAIWKMEQTWLVL